VIEFADVSVSYDGHRVLGPLSGTIETGGITSIVGPNGAGKSTLLTTLGRLKKPDAGRIVIGGLDVRSTPPRELAKKVAILRQENHFTARLRVRDLVALGRYPHSQGRLTARDQEEVDRALAFMDLEPLAERYLDAMSGGQRQRAFVAMVLAQQTDYLLLDEPLNNLDIKHSVAMMRELRRAADQLGRTVVIIVHDINFAAAWSDRLVALRDGAIVATGTADEIMRPAVLTSIFDTPVAVHELDGQKTATYYR
jgi:iron complex transport system ATP-binding protein